MKRALLYVHFNKYDELAEHVVYQLRQMKPLFDKVIFITNSSISKADLKLLEGLYDDFLQRKNEGFDFAAWRDGIRHLGWQELGEYDNVTLMNDTCFGPVYPMGPIYKRMEKTSADFWGITNHAATKYGMPGTNGPIPRHNQSYLGVFNSNVVRSQIFQDFWKGVQDFEDVTKVIQKYETQLTGILEQAAFTNAVLFDAAKNFTQNNSKVKENHSELHPDILLSKEVPFIKIKAFTHNSDNLYANNLLSLTNQLTKYDTRLIEDYFEQMFVPNVSIAIGDKIINHNNSKRLPEKIAVHIHAFYPDVLEKYLLRLKQWNFKYDLFLTVDSENKKNEIDKLMQKYKTTAKKIMITGIKGRDVVPWLRLTEHLKNYDVVGHFHTKKTATARSYIGEKWQDELFGQLFDGPVAYNILANFAANKKLGVVIPDMPNIFAYLGGTVFYKERKIKPLIEEMWLEMDTGKELDLQHYETYVMPYGMMFWYRPEALHKLGTLQLTDSIIPLEPLRHDFTVLHALERLIVYVVWEAGYQYRIAPSHEYTSRFFDNFAYNRTFTGIINAHELRLLVIWIKQRIKYIYHKLPTPLSTVVRRAYRKLR
jgi:rhamnosyltransferase